MAMLGLRVFAVDCGRVRWVRVVRGPVGPAPHALTRRFLDACRAQVSEMTRKPEAPVPRPLGGNEEKARVVKAGNQAPRDGGAEGEGTGSDMSDIGNKLAQLQMGRKGSRLRPMS